MNEYRNFGVTVKLTLAAVFAALVFIVTSQIPPIPIPATSGYFNVGETIIYVAALLFGSLVGALSGGIGAMLADMYLGFSVFAPGTLVIKGAEGTIVGLLNLKLRKYIPNPTVCAVVSVTVGGLEMVAGYFLYEQLVLGYPYAVALAEVPFNIVQMLVGLAIAVPIMHAVLRVFPQLKS
ncbi:ECF transporter S component [Candidatus Bathyarchaeota archaeon]|nr:ECF transporter S component [Candidatus Bathyarchaeota archaeon]